MPNTVIIAGRNYTDPNKPAQAPHVSSLGALRIGGDPDNPADVLTYALVSDTVSKPVRADASTHALESIEYAHHVLHDGNHYFLEGHTSLGIAGTLYVKLVTPNTARWGHLFWQMNSSGILTTTLDEDATGGMAGGLREVIHANNRNVNCWTGLHTGGNNVAILVDATKAWVPGSLVGYQVFNCTDGSSAFITANDATTVTAALAGGTDSDWDTGDAYEINRSGIVATLGVTACTGYTQRVSSRSFGSKQAGGAISREDEIVLKQNAVYCRSFTSGTASNIIGFKANWYEHTNLD